MLLIFLPGDNFFQLKSLCLVHIPTNQKISVALLAKIKIMEMIFYFTNKNYNIENVFKLYSPFLILVKSTIWNLSPPQFENNSSVPNTCYTNTLLLDMCLQREVKFFILTLHTKTVVMSTETYKMGVGRKVRPVLNSMRLKNRLYITELLHLRTQCI